MLRLGGGRLGDQGVFGGGRTIDRERERKKQWLRGYRAMERESRRLLEELEQWKSRAEKVTRSLGGLPGGGARGLPECVEKMVELERELNAKIECMVDRRREMEEAIGAVADPVQREVLRYRYINGYTWEKIAEKMGYDYRWVLRLHGKGLEHMQYDIK